MGKSNSAGVAILIRPKFNCEVIETAQDKAGRLITLHFKHDMHSMHQMKRIPIFSWSYVRHMKDFKTRIHVFWEEISTW